MTTPAAAGTRLDKWLWAVRLFRTRSVATDACRAGSVAVNELPAKPGRDVHAGETVTVQQGVVKRTLRVVGVPTSNASARQARSNRSFMDPRCWMTAHRTS